MVVVFSMLTTLAFFVVAVADSLDCEDPVHPDYCIVKDKLREELPANQLPFPVTIDVDVAVKINIVILVLVHYNLQYYSVRCLLHQERQRNKLFFSLSF